MKSGAVKTSVYVVLQPPGQSSLPTNGFYDSKFGLGNKERVHKVTINENGGDLLVGIHNPSINDAKVSIRYFTKKGDCNRIYSFVNQNQKI